MQFSYVWRFNESSLRTQGPIRRGFSFRALEQRPFFIFEARGDGSLRSQGRPGESFRKATTASTRSSIQVKNQFFFVEEIERTVTQESRC